MTLCGFLRAWYATTSISLVPAKTSYQRADVSHKPIVPALAAIIEASPIGKETYLGTSFGKPFTSNGFGNKFGPIGRAWGALSAGSADC